MSLTSFRQAVQTELESALGVTFVAGMVDEAQPDRDIGCVWVDGVRAWGTDALVEQVVLKARVFTQFEATQGYQQGDIEQLESLVEQLQTALKTIQNGTGGIWYMTLDEIQVLIEEHGIEATMTGYDRNPFETVA